MNPIQDLHSALAHAVYKGFSTIEYEDRDWEKYRKTKEDIKIKKLRPHSEHDILVHSMFPQTWSSTSLGFGGIGGQAITMSYTIILQSRWHNEHCVYFGGRFAYTLHNANQLFYKDIDSRNLAPVSKYSKYIDKLPAENKS